ncbi:SDR family NAD(P)-dependent oxidoreductase, partial [Thermogemmatispora sp.]|uniref:SDR family NAD(P)-dependent oxidoreductase n=1 Tax=Thermogemmatispora sp. TaxID=1968838 RepID=UPI00338F25D8
MDKAVEAFGQLGYAFNNAGIEQATAALADIPEEERERVLSVNLRGVFLCM